MKSDRFARRFLIGTGVGAAAAVGLALLRAPWPMPVNAASVAHVTGLLAGYLVAVLLALMSRTPVLEHRIGSDTLARWHARGGRTFLVLVLIHAGAAVQSWADSRHQSFLGSAVALWATIDATAAYARGYSASTWLRTRPGRTALIVCDDGSTITVRPDHRTTIFSQVSTPHYGGAAGTERKHRVPPD